MAVRRAAEQQTRRPRLQWEGPASSCRRQRSGGSTGSTLSCSWVHGIGGSDFRLLFHQLLGYQRAQWSLVGYTNANFNFYRSK